MLKVGGVFKIVPAILLLGTGSGTMASDIVQANAGGRRFDNLN